MPANTRRSNLLALLFVKYVSDKYAVKPYAQITVPKGASFKDMVALKGKPGIGDSINKNIIAPLEIRPKAPFGGSATSTTPRSSAAARRWSTG